MAAIFILDDSPVILEVICEVLKTHGHSPKGVSSQSSFLNALRKSTPALALIDVMLKDEDGHEFCIALKTNPQTCNIPVILISSNPQLLKHCERCYADDFLEIPFDYIDLKGKIDALLPQ